jgi:hypothetical protein
MPMGPFFFFFYPSFYPSLYLCVLFSRSSPFLYFYRFSIGSHVHSIVSRQASILSGSPTSLIVRLVVATRSYPPRYDRGGTSANQVQAFSVIHLVAYPNSL